MDNNERTLVIITPGFPENEADGNCLPMQQAFVRCLRELYPRLNIIILSLQYPYFKKTYTWFGATVICFDGRNKGGLSRVLLRRKLNRILKNINETTRITGLLSFWMGECALVAKRFADKYGFKHYCWILGQDAKKENKYPGLIRPKPDELIALSDFLQEEFEKNHATRPSCVIPSAIDPKQLNPATDERNIHILAAGSLIPLKQYDIFLEIVSELKNQLPQLKAILAGNGPEKAKLQSQIYKLGLLPNINLVGELPHIELLQLMQRSRVFLHPSSYEGFSGACLEAISAGSHVVSFCKAMKQEIKHWNIVHSKEAMKQRALEILQDPDPDHAGIVPFLMNNTTNAVVSLFDYSE